MIFLFVFVLSIKDTASMILKRDLATANVHGSASALITSNSAQISASVDFTSILTRSGKFEGDIDLIFPLSAYTGAGASSSDSGFARSAIRGDWYVWPNGVIPYRVSDQFNLAEKRLIASAISQYHSKTCLLWIPRTNEDSYVVFVRDAGCYSSVGRLGGRQTISLAKQCMTKGIVMHEMMHVAGFFHEHTRPDREEYIHVEWSNVDPGSYGQFEMYTIREVELMGTDYDYKSIMHYGPTAFTKNGGITMWPLKDIEGSLGGGNQFSSTDLYKLHTMYKCNDSSSHNIISTTSDCTSESEHCDYWAKLGECQKNPDYMKLKCRKSCDLCAPTAEDCLDNNHFCQQWAALNECQRNPIYMGRECQKSCSMC